ncbi:head maturation protease, ClpP-related [Paenibacillus ehimensis]|uniref:head maturation protease, ClpP-related n=1 Tax=Paenibacillus ehimensis TaxID=79264 RepID=UPI00046E7BCD|nr:head maturation protease, ClpP-related [Paenibacillus ehimensis]
MRFWNFKNLNDTESELRIEGEIVSDDDAWLYEWFGIQHAAPSAFRSALAEHKGKNLTVWVDSWGGDVFGGLGMYNAIKEHQGKVTVKIDGKAVSAGSIIAMAGDEVLMSPGSMIMIHNVWTITQGEAKDLRHQADVLDEIKEGLVNVYQQRTGLSRNKISRMMDEETWMSARKAIAEGFADGMLYGDVPAEEQVQNAFSLSRSAIMNSANTAMQRFFDFKADKKPAVGGVISGTPTARIGEGEVIVPLDSTKLSGELSKAIIEAINGKKQNTAENPAKNRVFDIQRRISVREKSFQSHRRN